VSFCFVFRLSTPKRRRRKRKRGAKKKGNFFRQLTVDAPAEVDEGSVDLDGRDRADDDVAYFFLSLLTGEKREKEREERRK